MAETLEASIEDVVATLRYPDSKSFREFVEALSKILDEARFEIGRDGVRVAGMDPAKIAYIEIWMPQDSFLEYSIDETRESVYMGVRLESLVNALKKGKKGESVLFKVSDDKIFIQVESAVVKRFLLPNIEVFIDVPENLTLEHDVEASVIAEAVKRAIKDVEVVGKDVEFEAEEGKLVIRAKAETRARVEAVLQEGVSSALLFLEVRKPSVSVYEVSYLKNVLNLTKIAEAVDIKFSSERPLEMVFKSPDGSRVRYLLAPSIA
ncbi:MAG: DNA polymerase sliding clamp [Desulfurococcales archaeon]|nr:DNA polymerase sliding clamp [Desulfurococcales archaeon]